MKCLSINLIGRLGNQMFQYAYAKALALQQKMELRTNAWPGQQLFEIQDGPITWAGDKLHEHYHQDQDSLIYSRQQARQWFKLRPNIVEQLRDVPIPAIAAHRRLGDYKHLNFPVVSESSYRKAAEQFGHDPSDITFITEETALKVPDLPDCAADFWRLMQAPVLFRGNSTFSWWAATLGHGKVYSPVIDHAHGGNQDVPFVEGNHPRCLELGFLTDLHLRES